MNEHPFIQQSVDGVVSVHDAFRLICLLEELLVHGQDEDACVREEREDEDGWG